jgi:anti-sigma regulatory factor (Ser/Thr protein kinase)
VERRQTFVPDATAVIDARRLVATILAEQSISDDVVYAAQLLTSELATNVIFHARTDFEVQVRVDDGGAKVAVKDWNSRMPQPCHAPADATTGRGLQMLDAMTSSWGAERTADGKVVWFELTL